MKFWNKNITTKFKNGIDHIREQTADHQNISRSVENIHNEEEKGKQLRNTENNMKWFLNIFKSPNIKVTEILNIDVGKCHK